MKPGETFSRVGAGVAVLAGLLLGTGPAAPALEYQNGDFQGTVGGSAELKMPVRFEPGTVKEVPSFTGTLKLEASFAEHLTFHCNLEAGYDGAARAPKNERVLLGFDRVYPSTDRYVQVPEAYLTLALASFDLRVGIQKFSWGTLDQFNPTDNVSPLDLRHLLDVSSTMERKIGVPAVRATYLFSPIDLNVEAIWLPFLVPYRLPDPDDRWYPPLLQTPRAVEIPPDVFGVALPPVSIRQYNDEARLPARTLGHSEFGVRVSRTFGSLDLGASFFNGYDRMPVVEGQGTATASVSLAPPDLLLSYDLHLLPLLRRVQIYGADMACSWRSFTFRAEGAYSKGRYFNVGLNAMADILSELELPSPSQIAVSRSRTGVDLSFPFSPTIAYQKDFLSVGLGVDYQWGNHLITVQTIGNQILDYRGEPLVYEEFEIMVVLGLHSRFLEDTLQVESGLVLNPMEKLVLSRTEATYAVTDAFSVGASLLLLDGEAQSPLGQFRRNDQCSLFMKYHF